MKIFKIPIAVLVLFSVLFVIACPKKDAVRTAAKASYRLPGTTNDLIARIKLGVDRGIFTPAEARRFGEILEPITKAEVAFVQIAKTVERIYRETGSVPAHLSQELKDKYDEIVNLFLDLLQFAGVLDASDRLFIETAVATVRLLLRTIGVGLGSEPTVKRLDAAIGPGSGAQYEGLPQSRPDLPPKRPLTKKGITSAGLSGSIPLIRF